MLCVPHPQDESDFYNGLYQQSKIKVGLALCGDARTGATHRPSLSVCCCFGCFQFDSFVKSGTVLQNYATVLELLLRLRQACNHPFLVLESLNKSRKKVRASLVRLRSHTQYSLTGRLWRETPQTAQDFEAFLDSKFFENSASYFQTLRTKLLATVNKTREGDGDEAKKEEADLNDDIPTASDGDEGTHLLRATVSTVSLPS